MPILQSRRRARRAANDDDDSHTLAPATALPPYEPPFEAMSASAQDQLGNLEKFRDTRKLQNSLPKVSELLRDTVREAAERVLVQRRNVEAHKHRRKKSGAAEKSSAELDAEKRLQRLYEEMTGVVGELEGAARLMIDYGAELEDESKAFRLMHTEILGQAQKSDAIQKALKGRAEDLKQEAEEFKQLLDSSRNRRRSECDESGSEGDKGDSADEKNEEIREARIRLRENTREQRRLRQQLDNREPLTGPSEMLEKHRLTLASSYLTMSMHQRYALNNDYIAFKNAHHSAVYPDEEAVLPDPKTWFDEEGRPVLTDLRGGVDDRVDAEEDLVVMRENISVSCPLTLRTFGEPYTSKVCKHTFEKEAIFSFLSERPTNPDKQHHCPVCSKVMRKDDLFPDQVMVRRVAQRKQREQQDENEDFDEDESVDDE